MLSSRSLLALLLPPLLLLGAALGPARALSADERREMVELHNLYRAQAAAANMLRMVSVGRTCQAEGCGPGPPPTAPVPQPTLSPRLPLQPGTESLKLYDSQVPLAAPL